MELFLTLLLCWLNLYILFHCLQFGCQGATTWEQTLVTNLQSFMTSNGIAESENSLLSNVTQIRYYFWAQLLPGSLNQTVSAPAHAMSFITPNKRPSVHHKRAASPHLHVRKQEELASCIPVSDRKVHDNGQNSAKSSVRGMSVEH